jgi:hypothetical protein
MTQLLRPVIFIHRRDEQACISSVDAEAVVNNAGTIVLQHRAEQLYGSARRFNLESIGSGARRFDFVKAGGGGVAAGRDGVRLFVVDDDVELASARLLQVIDFHARKVLARLARRRRRKARILARAAGAETYPTQTELASVTGRPHRFIVPAAARSERDGVVAVPGPGSIHQDETVPGVAKTGLQQAPNRAGDAVIGNRRITIMGDARNRARLTSVRARKLGIEGIQSFRGVFNRMLTAHDNGRIRTRRRKCFLKGCGAAARNAAIG